MTPSPPMPRWRSHRMAAWAGVRDGVGEWRLSTFLMEGVGERRGRRLGCECSVFVFVLCMCACVCMCMYVCVRVTGSTGRGERRRRHRRRLGDLWYGRLRARARGRTALLTPQLGTHAHGLKHTPRTHPQSYSFFAHPSSTHQDEVVAQALVLDKADAGSGRGCSSRRGDGPGHAARGGGGDTTQAAGGGGRGAADGRQARQHGRESVVRAQGEGRRTKK